MVLISYTVWPSNGQYEQEDYIEQNLLQCIYRHLTIVLETWKNCQPILFKKHSYYPTHEYL